MTYIVRNVRVVTPPAYEPVTLAEAKTWCRILSDADDQDGVIRMLITAAREHAEHLTGRAFIQRDLELLMDSLPDGSDLIELPFAPIQTVTYIRYLDGTEVDQELSGSPLPWIFDGGSFPGRLSPVYGGSWSEAIGTPSSVRIGYRAGYAPIGSPDDEAAHQAALPGVLKLWMQVRIASFYEQREAMVLGSTVTEIKRDFVDGLLDSLVINRGFG